MEFFQTQCYGQLTYTMSTLKGIIGAQGRAPQNMHPKGWKASLSWNLGIQSIESYKHTHTYRHRHRHTHIHTHSYFFPHLLPQVQPFFVNSSQIIIYLSKSDIQTACLGHFRGPISMRPLCVEIQFFKNLLSTCLVSI